MEIGELASVARTAILRIKSWAAVVKKTGADKPHLGRPRQCSVEKGGGSIFAGR